MNHQQKNKWFILFAILFSPSILFALGAGGISNETGVSARALAYGYSFAGLADDASAIWFNPAGLTQVKGFQLMTGVAVLKIDSEHTSMSGVKDRMAPNTPVAPNFYISYSGESSPFAMGIGVNAPFGLITEWKDDSSFSRFYATKSKVLMYNLNPTLAYAINEKISIGGGLDYFNLYDTELDRKSYQAPFPSGSSSISGDGTGWGYNFGVHWIPLENHMFGISYRSQVNVPIKGTSEIKGSTGATLLKTDVTTELKFPQSITLGYAFKPNQKWILTTDYEWMNWSVVDKTKFNFSQYQANLHGPDTIQRNWRSTNNIGFGAQYKLNKLTDLRFGSFIFERVIPSENLEATLPESSRFGITLGSGFHFRNITIDIGYNAIFFNDRNINNGNEIAGLYSQDGKFKTMINVFSLGFSQKWGGHGS